jgi:gamma-aminobutyric acid type B receptor
MAARDTLSLLMLLLLLLSINYSFKLVDCSTVVTVMNNTQPLQVITVIPTEYDSGDVSLTPDWKKGEEILPGAYLAAKQINDISDLIGGHRFEIIPVRVPQCQLTEGIVPFVEELTSNYNNTIGIVGYFCHNIAQHLSRLVHHNVIQISANDDSAPRLQHSILPLRESMASATAHLLQSLGWKKVAVISSHHPNFEDSKRAFLRSAKERSIQISLFQETFKFLSPIDYLRELQMFGIKIIVAFVPQSEAIDILCTAHLRGFKWPDYAWIFTDMSKPKLYCQPKALNNAVFLHAKFNIPKNLSSGLNSNSYYDAIHEQPGKYSSKLNFSLPFNPYANVLYDSIWAVALTINRSLSVLTNERDLSLVNINQDTGMEIMSDVLEEQLSQLAFQGATGWLNFSHSAAAVQTSIEILQIQNRQLVQIGLYYHSLNQLFLNESSLRIIPSDTLERVYVVYPTALTVFLSLVVIFCIILTTFLMLLFIYYRKEPEIKATSFTLSLCMFVGCYLLLTSGFFHSVTSGTTVYGSQESLRTFICMFDITTVGIGADVILATVIAKTLRIYHIFKKFGTVSRVCSDQGLFILISSIISVKIVMLIVWATSDAAYVVDIEQFISTTVPPFFRVIQECQSNYHNIWLLVLFGYSIILGLVMVLLAVLTRKIKRRNYKDSKKINILVAALIVDTCIGVPLWIMFRSIASTILSRLSYNIGTIVAAFLCQMILILPKTLPLIVRKYRSRCRS